jgi:hypothetical protein
MIRYDSLIFLSWAGLARHFRSGIPNAWRMNW